MSPWGEGSPASQTSQLSSPWRWLSITFACTRRWAGTASSNPAAPGNFHSRNPELKGKLVNELLPLLAVGLIAAVIWLFSKPEAVFVVRVRGGNAEATNGKVTASFLAAVAEVCHEFAIPSGEVRGVVRGRRIALRFTRHFPPVAQQRLRNWWAQSGWPPPRTRRPRR